VLTDGQTLVPPMEDGAFESQLSFPAPVTPRSHTCTWLIFPPGLGLKASIETIDNRGDFKTYMQNYAFARGSAPPRGPRREGPSDEGFVCVLV